MQSVAEQTVELPAEQLAKHAMCHAYEGPHEESSPPMGFDEDSYDLYDAHNNIVYVDTITDDEGRTGLCIEAELEGTVSERTSRGNRWHPPEYDTETVPVRVVATWVPRDRLDPDTTLRVEYEGDPFGPPEPDIEAYRYDL